MIIRKHGILSLAVAAILALSLAGCSSKSVEGSTAGLPGGYFGSNPLPVGATASSWTLDMNDNDASVFTGSFISTYDGDMKAALQFYQSLLKNEKVTQTGDQTTVSGSKADGTKFDITLTPASADSAAGTLITANVSKIPAVLGIRTLKVAEVFNQDIFKVNTDGDPIVRRAYIIPKPYASAAAQKDYGVNTLSQLPYETETDYFTAALVSFDNLTVVRDQPVSDGSKNLVTVFTASKAGYTIEARVFQIDKTVGDLAGYKTGVDISIVPPQ